VEIHIKTAHDEEGQLKRIGGGNAAWQVKLVESLSGIAA
jgi:hypothetical protein